MRVEAKRPRASLLITIFLLVACVSPSIVWSQAARSDYANHFFRAEAQVGLAKQYLDQDQPLVAFQILEDAKRNHFSPRAFQRAFEAIFLGVVTDTSERNEKQLLRAIEQEDFHPEVYSELSQLYRARGEWGRAKQVLAKLLLVHSDDFDLYLTLADVYIQSGETAKAQELMAVYEQRNPRAPATLAKNAERAMITEDLAQALNILEPALEEHPEDGRLLMMRAWLHRKYDESEEATDLYVRAGEARRASADAQGDVAHYFLKQLRDDERALEYYLRAYFLDTDYRDQAPGDKRVNVLSRRLAEQEFATLGNNPTSMMKALEDPNPVLVMLALSWAGKNWQPSYAQEVVELLGHSAPDVRRAASAVLVADKTGQVDDVLRRTLDLTDDPIQRAHIVALAIKREWEDRRELAKPLLWEGTRYEQHTIIHALLRGDTHDETMARGHLEFTEDNELWDWFEDARR